MPAPIVSWFNAANDTQETSWDLGVVDAGSISADKQFLIWNNRGGGTDVSDMTNCTVTTKDTAGGDTGELVTGTWIETQVDSMGEAGFTGIGGTTTKPIEAGGTNTTSNQTIAGAANSGDVAAEDNFVAVTFHANVDPAATAGTIEFLIRVSYQYV
jgi:hypothetical protein